MRLHSRGKHRSHGCRSVPYSPRWRPGQGRDLEVAPHEPAQAHILADPADRGAPAAMDPHQATAHDRRNRRRLATAVRQAAMHATADEMLALQALVDATTLGTVTVDDARAAVADLRRAQQQRNAWPPRGDEHNPKTCERMVCPECVARIPPRTGNADPFRLAA